MGVGRLLKDSRAGKAWAEDWSGCLERDWLAMDRFKSLIADIDDRCRTIVVPGLS